MRQQHFEYKHAPARRKFANAGTLWAIAFGIAVVLWMAAFIVNNIAFHKYQRHKSTQRTVNTSTNHFPITTLSRGLDMGGNNITNATLLLKPEGNVGIGNLSPAATTKLTVVRNTSDNL